MTAFLAWTAWYLISGLIIVLVGRAPGALVDVETGEPKTLDGPTWIVVWLAWPFFMFCWTRNLFL